MSIAEIHSTLLHTLLATIDAKAEKEERLLSELPSGCDGAATAAIVGTVFRPRVEILLPLNIRQAEEDSREGESQESEDGQSSSPILLHPTDVALDQVFSMVMPDIRHEHVVDDYLPPDADDAAGNASPTTSFFRPKESMALVPVVIAGDRGAGKTTFSAALLSGAMRIMQALRYHRSELHNLWFDLKDEEQTVVDNGEQPQQSSSSLTKLQTLVSEAAPSDLNSGGSAIDASNGEEAVMHQHEDDDERSRGATTTASSKREMPYWATDLSVGTLEIDPSELVFFLEDDEIIEQQLLSSSRKEEEGERRKEKILSQVSEGTSFLTSAVDTNAGGLGVSRQHAMVQLVELGGDLLNYMMAKETTIEGDTKGMKDRKSKTSSRDVSSSSVKDDVVRFALNSLNRISSNCNPAVSYFVNCETSLTSEEALEQLVSRLEFMTLQIVKTETRDQGELAGGRSSRAGHQRRFTLAEDSCSLTLYLYFTKLESLSPLQVRSLKDSLQLQEIEGDDESEQAKEVNNEQAFLADITAAIENRVLRRIRTLGRGRPRETHSSCEEDKKLPTIYVEGFLAQHISSVSRSNKNGALVFQFDEVLKTAHRLIRGNVVSTKEAKKISARKGKKLNECTHDDATGDVVGETTYDKRRTPEHYAAAYGLVTKMQETGFERVSQASLEHLLFNHDLVEHAEKKIGERKEEEVGEGKGRREMRQEEKKKRKNKRSVIREALIMPETSSSLCAQQSIKVPTRPLFELFLNCGGSSSDTAGGHHQPTLVAPMVLYDHFHTSAEILVEYGVASYISVRDEKEEEGSHHDKAWGMERAIELEKNIPKREKALMNILLKSVFAS